MSGPSSRHPSPSRAEPGDGRLRREGSLRGDRSPRQTGRGGQLLPARQPDLCAWRSWRERGGLAVGGQLAQRRRGERRRGGPGGRGLRVRLVRLLPSLCPTAAERDCSWVAGERWNGGADTLTPSKSSMRWKKLLRSLFNSL